MRNTPLEVTTGKAFFKKVLQNVNVRQVHVGGDRTIIWQPRDGQVIAVVEVYTRIASVKGEVWAGPLIALDNIATMVVDNYALNGYLPNDYDRVTLNNNVKGILTYENPLRLQVKTAPSGSGLTVLEADFIVFGRLLTDNQT